MPIARLPRRVLAEADDVDCAIYDAIAVTPTPTMDDAMRRITHAANYSRLSMSAAALIAFTGGQTGRRAATSGLTSLAATSAIVNLVVKPVARRRRPRRPSEGYPDSRRVAMPDSRSFPSGHTAAAVAFASGAGRVWPAVSVPMHAISAVVGYSRVHTGVHYPGDVVAGAVIGAVVSDVVATVRSSALRRGGAREVLHGDHER